MDALVLGGQIAAARADLLRKPCLAEVDRHHRSGAEPRKPHVEPVADRAGWLQQEELAADRVDRDLDAAVVVDVCRRETAPVHAQPRCDARRDAVSGDLLAGERSDHLHRAGVLLQARDRDPAGRDHEIRPARVRQVGERVAPAREVGSECRVEVGPRARERGRGRPRERGRRLVARVGDEQVERTAFGAVDGDAHAGVRIRHPRCGGAVLEAEAEPRRVRLRSARPRDVDVELVRILVVRDVEVGTSVAVDVQEGRAEAVREAGRLETCLDPDLAEARATVRPVSLVQEEEVADSREVRREARERVRDGVVRACVAGHEHVRAAVAVHVRDGDPRVPARRGHPGGPRTLGEGAVAVVPEQLDPGRRRHDQVGPAVAVQIRCRAAVALHPKAGAGCRGDVAEVPVNVLEQLRARQPAVRLPLRRVGAGVRVDGEQVLPAVAVVVEPADPAAHHRRVLLRGAVPEGPLPEVETDGGRDVRQPDAAQHRAHRRGLDLSYLRRRRECPVPVRGLVQVVAEPGLLDRRRRRALLHALDEPDAERAGAR